MTIIQNQIANEDYIQWRRVQSRHSLRSAYSIDAAIAVAAKPCMPGAAADREPVPPPRSSDVTATIV